MITPIPGMVASCRPCWFSRVIVVISPDPLVEFLPLFAEFLQQPLMQTIVWLRMPGDVIFSVGVGLLAIFVFRLFVGKARDTMVVGTPVEVEATTTGSGR